MTNSTLTAEQLDAIRDKYANTIVSDMDVKALEHYVYTNIIEQLNELDEFQLVTRIEDEYDIELVEDFVRSVTLNRPNRPAQYNDGESVF